jgi:hypothetical protein
MTEPIDREPIDREPIDRIEAALSRLGAQHEPPVGWEAKVLAATATSTATHAHIGYPKQGHPRNKWWWLAVPAVAAAVIAIVVAPRVPNDSHLPLALRVSKGGSVVRAASEGGSVVRGTSAQVGEGVQAAATGGGPYRAVWIYHNDALVLACPGAEQCRVSEGATNADFTPRLIGEYVIVALSSRSPISRPTGAFDVDVAHAHDAGAMEKIERLTVR